MLRAASVYRQAGFSLIELMVVVTIAALLMMAAVPAISGWIADARVRSSAETLQNAVRVAQAEAMRRSRTAVLALTTATPALAATPAANSPRWFVRLLARSTDSSTEAAGLYVRGGTEPASMNVAVTGPALLCFNALGQQTTLTSAETGLGVGCTSQARAQYTLSSAGASRQLKIQVGLGGQVRLCDASKTFSDAVLDGCDNS